MAYITGYKSFYIFLLWSFVLVIYKKSVIPRISNQLAVCSHKHANGCGIVGKAAPQLKAQRNSTRKYICNTSIAVQK
jgi:hypothetical protein